MPIKTRSFHDRKHDYSEKLLTKGRIRTRQQIIDYYMRNAAKIFPWLKDQRVMVLSVQRAYDKSSNKHVIIRRRKMDGQPTKWITIKRIYGVDDPYSFEYYVYRRGVEFHPSIRKRTNLIWLDLDAYTPTTIRILRKHLGLFRNMLKSALKAYKPRNIQTWKSPNGFHITARVNTIATDRAKYLLHEYFNETLCMLIPKYQRMFKVGQINRRSQIRVDLATLKNNGSIRAPYTISINTGVIKKLIK